jgi:pimeloyl-ACP methyl ester carboxylesterase
MWGRTTTPRALAIGGDRALGTGVGEAAKKIAKNVTAVSVKDCGHYVPEEQPEELIRLIKDLLN